MSYLEIKGLILVVGAGVGVAGMVSNRNWLVYAGIAILAVGFLLRFAKRPRDD